MSDNPNTKSKKSRAQGSKAQRSKAQGSTVSARQRLQAERARQQRNRAHWRKAGIGAVVVAIAAAGIAIAIGTASGSSSASGRAVVPAHASGPNGTVIVYGNPGSRNTLAVYEDFRCPFCDELEKTDGNTIQQLADSGLYKIQYHMGTFLDENLGGDGSMKALQAAGAALNEGTAEFKAFHDVLYANQPDERSDAFAGTGYLLNLAAKVPGLSTPSFVAAVRAGTYAGWAHKVSDAFNHSGVQSTPTVDLNGQQLSMFGASGKVLSPGQFAALIESTLKAHPAA